jgi:hypothetical protein
MSELIRLSCPSIELQAAGEPDEKSLKCRVLAYSGAEMTVPKYGRCAIDLQGLRAGDQVPLLIDHDTSLEAVAGFGEPETKDGALIINGTLSDATPGGKIAIGLVRAGMKLQASVGVVPEDTQRIDKGQNYQCNGRLITATAPLTLVKGSVLKEVSLVTLGADATTSVSVAASRRNSSIMSTDIANHEELIRAERQRVSDIEAACNGFGDDAAVKNLRAKAIAGDLDLQQLNAGLLGILRGKRVVHQAVANPAMYGTRSNSEDVLAAAILAHAGDERTAVKAFGAETAQRARDLKLHSFIDILRAAWTAQGLEPPRDKSEMIRASGSSIVSLPNILSNALNKSLAENYALFPSAARQIWRTLNANDFKLHREMRLTSDSMLKVLPVSGEIEPAQLGEQVFPWSVSTFARVIKITRELIVNDDLSAFSTIPQLFARGCALAQEDLFFRLVLSNPSNFYHSNNANLLTGTTAGPTNSAISLEGLSNAYITLMQQVDDAGYPIGAVPRFLLCPPELKLAADSLFHSTTVVASPTAAAGAALLPSGNPLFGLAEPITSPYLSNSSYTGYSTTAWYLLTAPAGGLASWGMGFLGGNEAPIVESVPSPANELGWSFRAFCDFGAAALDPRASVKCAGA